MLYREIIAVCSQIHTKHKNTLCGQNVESLNVKPSEWYIYQTQGAKMVEKLAVAVTTTLPQMALHTVEVVWADNDLETAAINSKLKEIKRSTWGSCLRPPTDRMQEPFHQKGMRPLHPLQRTVTARAANGVAQVQWDMTGQTGSQQNLTLQNTNISPVPNSTQILVRYSKCSFSVQLIK